jgi:23S rRNA pseudouridine955/2504/2580 synthase
MNNNFIQWTVTSQQENTRLDKFLRWQYPIAPKRDLRRFLRHKDVRLNGSCADGGERLKNGDAITLTAFAAKVLQTPARIARISHQSEMIDNFKHLIYANILWEDEYLLALNKPYGLAVQGGSGIITSVDALVRNGLRGRPWLQFVHRLDRATTGVILLAKDVQTAQELTKIFRSRQNISKEYLLLVHGDIFCRTGTINSSLLKKYEDNQEKVYVDNVAGKEAITNYEVLAYSRKFHQSLVRAFPLTGRTHQIRVHFKSIGNPLVGDFKYGAPVSDHREQFFTQLQLHAHCIILDLRQLHYKLVADIPFHMQGALEKVFGYDWRKLLNDSHSS